jgi:DNA processing protein
MTIDHLVALSLVRELSRRSLTERLQASDPELGEQAGRLLARAAALRTRAASTGLQFLPWNDPAFPPALLAIPDCPPGLWYQGALDPLTAPCVAVVGSRAGSPAALATAAQMAAGLAARGVTVVSGLARGVDSAAHGGALRTGRTVAVLGSGHHRLYPREHHPLAVEIATLGAVLSEFPPDVPALPFHFPMRNRLISGLCRAVVVIEAAEGSGSLITASSALEQGRDVMVVPGAVAGGRNTGGHALIRDGATIVEGAADVLAELGLPAGAVERDKSASPSAGSSSGDSLLSCMAAGHAYDLDDLASLSGVSIPRLLGRLSRLELEGQVRRADGGRFIRAS